MTTVRDALARLATEKRERSAVAADAAELVRDARGYRWVGLYDVTATEIVALAWTGNEAPAFPRFSKTRGLSGSAVATGRPVISQDVASDPRYLEAFATTGSEAIFPILDSAGVVVGTLDVESDRRDAFSSEDEDFLRECARSLGQLREEGSGTPARHHGS